MSGKLSPTQLETLRRMAADDGRLERTKGGFWVTPNTTPGKHGFAYEWWTNVQTVRAMEKRGLIERTRELAEEWRDPRRITDAGLAAVAAVVEESPVRAMYARLAANYEQEPKVPDKGGGLRGDLADIAEMRATLGAKHFKVEGTLAALGLDDADAYECMACRVAWPCDVAKLLAVLP